MLRWPGHIDPLRDEANPVSSVDLAPTILRACGLTPTPAMQGVDLLDARARGARSTIFGATYAHDIEDVDDPTRSLHSRWLVHGRFKFIVPHAARLPERRTELFDLLVDPFETNDLAPSQPALVAELDELLDAWWPGPSP